MCVYIYVYIYIYIYIYICMHVCIDDMFAWTTPKVNLV